MKREREYKLKIIFEKVFQNNKLCSKIQNFKCVNVTRPKLKKKCFIIYT